MGSRQTQEGSDGDLSSLCSVPNNPPAVCKDDIMGDPMEDHLTISFAPFSTG